MHAACLRGDTASLHSLFKLHPSSLNQPDSNGNTPLHMACITNSIDCVQALVEYGANVNALNSDSLHDDGSVESGGRTPLHMAAQCGNTVIIEYLLQHGADPNIDDLDSFSAFELYYSDPNHSSLGLSEATQTLLTPCKDLEASRQARKQILVTRKQQKKQLLRAFVAQRYARKFPQIFIGWEESMFHQEFLHFMKSPKGMTELTEIIEEVAPRVYAFKLFSLDFCKMMLEELENFESTDLPKSRPNSMNNYGVILDDMGFNEVMHQLVLQYISPVASLLFKDYGGDSLDSHHSFMVRYRVGEDLDLKTHMDDAEVTINVCLGKTFTGSTLYFKGFPGKPTKENLQIEYLSFFIYLSIH